MVFTFVLATTLDAPTSSAEVSGTTTLNSAVSGRRLTGEGLGVQRQAPYPNTKEKRLTPTDEHNIKDNYEWIFDLVNNGFIDRVHVLNGIKHRAWSIPGSSRPKTIHRIARILTDQTMGTKETIRLSAPNSKTPAGYLNKTTKKNVHLQEGECESARSRGPTWIKKTARQPCQLFTYTFLGLWRATGHRCYNIVNCLFLP